jgi:hypothetical protein
MAYNKKTTDTTTVEHVTHHSGHDEAHFREKHLMLDPLPRGQMNDMIMEAMHHTTWKFWVVWGLLAAVVAYGLFYSWGVMILEGLGVAGVNRPSYSGSASAMLEHLSPQSCVCSKLNFGVRSHVQQN